MRRRRRGGRCSGRRSGCRCRRCRPACRCRPGCRRPRSTRPRTSSGSSRTSRRRRRRRRGSPRSMPVDASMFGVWSLTTANPTAPGLSTKEIVPRSPTRMSLAEPPTSVSLPSPPKTTSGTVEPEPSTKSSSRAVGMPWNVTALVRRHDGGRQHERPGARGFAGNEAPPWCAGRRPSRCRRRPERSSARSRSARDERVLVGGEPTA